MFCVSADRPIVHEEEDELEHEKEDEVEDELESDSMSHSLPFNERKLERGRKKPVVHAVTPELQPPTSPESTKPVSRKKPLQHASMDTKVYCTKRALDDDNDDIVSSKRRAAWQVVAL